MENCAQITSSSPKKSRTATSELPPRSKKLSRKPMGRIFRTFSHSLIICKSSESRETAEVEPASAPERAGAGKTLSIYFPIGRQRENGPGLQWPKEPCIPAAWCEDALSPRLDQQRLPAWPPHIRPVASLREHLHERPQCTNQLPRTLAGVTQFLQAQSDKPCTFT